MEKIEREDENMICNVNPEEIYTPHETNIRKFWTDDDKDVSTLMSSIKKIGQLQPATLNTNPDLIPKGHIYRLASGFRRHNACLKLGIHLKCIKRYLTEKDEFLLNGTENMERKNLTPYEEGTFFRKSIDIYKMTTNEVAEKFNKSKTYIKRRLDIVSRIPKEFRKDVANKEKGRIPAGKISPTSANIAVTSNGNHRLRKSDILILLKYAKKDNFADQHTSLAKRLHINNDINMEDACYMAQNGYSVSIKMMFKNNLIKKDAKRKETSVQNILCDIIEGKTNTHYELFRKFK